ncbi:MAG TPA: L-ribulose-5-phosphate 4-epimerase [Vicinamibacterales bacterium]|jgi:L-ribulose-5-phosphate 4-epimerase
MSTIGLLRGEVHDANLELVRRGLVVQAFGNASAIDRDTGLVVIKPSGVPYGDLSPDHLVVTDLDGKIVEGPFRPSSDLPTHLALYRAFPDIGGVVHTHSRFATVWAQAGREIPCLGTTHADYFRGAVPITDPMTPDEIGSEYEWNTGQAIVRRFAPLDPAEIPAVLVSGHGPFCWGTSAGSAVDIAVVLEEVACIAWHTMAIRPDAEPLPTPLRDKHFLRKHGPKAYYGQG